MTDQPSSEMHGSTQRSGSCGCNSCSAADLQASPFVSLRVAYGMLLGESDFHALMANPRGKQMLHNAWLHGSGVVHGLDVHRDGTRNLEVLPGLALDGVGRELYQDSRKLLDVRQLLKDAGITRSDQADRRAADQSDSAAETLTLHLVAEFDACPSNAVPTLADPCDVTRQRDQFSRVREQVSYSLRRTGEDKASTKRAPGSRGYHRVRVLLGLEKQQGDDDDAGRDAVAARQRAAAAPPVERAGELLHEFRLLAAADEVELKAAIDSGGCYPTIFPEEEDKAGVVLAAVVLSLRDAPGTLDTTIDDVDISVRTVLLPTSAVQDLLCGLAPALIGITGTDDGGGPRVVGDASLSDDGRTLSFEVSAPVLQSSLRRAIGITSLSERGWVEEDIDTVRYEDKPQRVVIELADRPVNELIRLIVLGTGPTPVYGDSPRVPLAGRVGGPPGTADNGHDAVLTFANPLTNRRAEA
ncbi:hypothetical protein [Pseudarthrobacter sulfonivorans]|uniref:hypothetical protein n=1 Tax=Pseudarthrobacter sulfonivorans TaxID=121292 RepID=UPI0021031E56|nr:hypothetical protein [Pseudarthrobacter sulfonivorans]